MKPKFDKWGWKQVSIVGAFTSGSGSKRWKCNHCDRHYNGSYSRVRAHLLGFQGLGVKPCPAIDASTIITFRILDKNHLSKKLMKRKAISKGKNPSTRCNNDQMIQLDHNFPHSVRNFGKEEVDGTVSRFFYEVGVNVDVIESSYFREMVKTIGSFGPQYELPSIEQLGGSLLTNEKARLGKALALVKESWPYTGCSILCANRLDGSLGCFCVNFFVASPRGFMFLKEVDIIEGDGPDNQFINELSTAISEVGPSNVIQVITRLSGQASEAFESIILSKFPHIFWSHCASHSILLLMEEIAEHFDWIKSLVSCAKEIEQYVSSFQKSSSSVNIRVLKELSDNVSQRFAPSYFFVRKIFESKETLCQVVLMEEWKQWRGIHVSEGCFSIEEELSNDEFWAMCQLMINVFDPFMRQLGTFDVDKSVMGDVYNWRISSLEWLKSKGNINQTLMNELESLIEQRWDNLFSPLHGVAYILHPKHHGKSQSEDKSLMRAWNGTIERYEVDTNRQTLVREELEFYWKSEGCFGDTDAIECRGNMEPVSWWENFGFETPRLQSLAIKILSQITSSFTLCRESWRCDNMSCKEDIHRFGMDMERAKDLVFVRNNLRFYNLRTTKMSSQFGLQNGNFCSTSLEQS